jgi:glycosyltransferase involved in cell wall biosynthesis
LLTHRALGTYRNKVTRYIVLNQFCRDKFIQGGLPAELLRIKPNFVAPGETPQWQQRRGALFVGRLAPEKGLDVLIKAMQSMSDPELKLIGSGPLEPEVRRAFGSALLGFQPMAQLRDMLGTAQFLIAPSTCYETFGLAALEAFSCGTPVIASRHGGLGELVKDGITGLLFTPGDASDLAEKIAWARAHPLDMLQMGRQAYAEYQARYTPERNYDMLIDIYKDAIAAVLKPGLGACHAA